MIRNDYTHNSPSNDSSMKDTCLQSQHTQHDYTNENTIALWRYHPHSFSFCFNIHNFLQRSHFKAGFRLKLAHSKARPNPFFSCAGWINFHFLPSCNEWFYLCSSSGGSIPQDLTFLSLEERLFTSITSFQAKIKLNRLNRIQKCEVNDKSK